MALIDKLTAIADAIRGKTGKTEEMTLDQMPLEIASIVSGGGSGGDSHNNPWVSYETAEIEIGENTVTNFAEVLEFFKVASGFDVVDGFVILNNPTTHNQPVFSMDRQRSIGSGHSTGYRYRNGVISEITMNASFDAVLVPGTKYLIRKVIVNTSNINPY